MNDANYFEHHQKTLVVPSNFQRSGWASNNELRLQAGIAKIAFENSYRIISFDGNTSSLNTGNPNELGYGILNHGDRAEFPQSILDEYGFRSPNSIDFKDILNADLVVAKLTKGMDPHEGNSVFLLKTPLEKARFMAYALTCSKLHHILNKENPYKFVDTIVEQILKNDFSNQYFDFENLKSCFRFEEYVPTFGTRNTSFRILVDGKGNHHYTAVILGSVKGLDNLDPDPALNRTSSNSFLNHHNLPGDETLGSVFLKHYMSPYYIGLRNITSNYSYDGTGVNVYLPNEIEQDSTISSEFQALGIDASKLTLPFNVIEAAKEIAIYFRYYNPYIGVDVICRNNNGTPEYVFVEANWAPDLIPRYFNMPENVDRVEMYLEMYKRILES